jgi:glucosamine 6-phosphate synthetase-like amidotransferase/phosphosugar isomerase protein
LLCCHGSAVIEHTNRVIFLEDDDVAAVTNGRLTIHRIKRTAGDHPARAIQTLQMELQQIMKGEGKVEGRGWVHSTVMGNPL